MTIERIALDTNLFLLLAVGRAERGLIARHKRLQRFSDTDFDILMAELSRARALVTTPNAMTEVSNILDFGLSGASRARVIQSVQELAMNCLEAYRASGSLVVRAEFERLGLADRAWLAILDPGTTLLTVDNDLYAAALNQGGTAVNFDHVRATRQSL